MESKKQIQIKQKQIHRHKEQTGGCQKEGTDNPKIYMELQESQLPRQC